MDAGRKIIFLPPTKLPLYLCKLGHRPLDFTLLFFWLLDIHLYICLFSCCVYLKKKKATQDSAATLQRIES